MATMAVVVSPPTHANTDFAFAVLDANEKTQVMVEARCESHSDFRHQTLDLMANFVPRDTPITLVIDSSDNLIAASTLTTAIREAGYRVQEELGEKKQARFGGGTASDICWRTFHY